MSARYGAEIIREFHPAPTPSFLSIPAKVIPRSFVLFAKVTKNLKTNRGQPASQMFEFPV